MYKITKQIALIGIILLAGINAAHSATVYTYENNSSRPIMETYKTTWNETTEELTLSSTWKTSAALPVLDKISFLLSDGGSPWVGSSSNEQFLWYELDLATETLRVQTYKSGRTTLQTFVGAAQGVSVTNNSIQLNIDHSFLNSLTGADFAGYDDYNGAGFSTDIGIWYYMYSGGVKVETLDVHHATPTVSEVPVPAALLMFAPALLGFMGFRQKGKKQAV